MPTRYTIGIDEVGRGPIAGPVAVAAFLILDYSFLSGIDLPLRDSKKLSPQKRREWVGHLSRAKRTGKCFYAHTFVSASYIDKKGITKAIQKALDMSLLKVAREVCRHGNLDEATFRSLTHVKLDGGLKAPHTYVSQQTIIKGDEREREIALASIVAKVARDAYMEKRAILYPEYGFDAHVGYGTNRHYRAITKHGLSPLHRKSFLGSLTKKAPRGIVDVK